jgi:hypothetical protein
MGENMKKYLLGIFFCVLMLFSLSATIPSQQLNDPDASWNMSGIYADLEARGEPEDTVAMVWIPLSDGDYFIMQMKTRFKDGELINHNTGEHHTGDFALNTFLFKPTIETEGEYCMRGNALFFKAGGTETIQ